MGKKGGVIHCFALVLEGKDLVIIFRPFLRKGLLSLLR